jgi:hypothetical protein
MGTSEVGAGEGGLGCLCVVRACLCVYVPPCAPCGLGRGFRDFNLKSIL